MGLEKQVKNSILPKRNHMIPAENPVPERTATYLNRKEELMLQFLKTHLWTIRSNSKPFFIRQGLKGLRVAILTFRMYLRNDCALRASALTFFTLLSIIPVLALGFAVAKGFGLYERLEQWLYSVFSDYPGIAEKMVEFSSNTLNGAKGGVIAGVGSIMLLYTTIKLLMQIEDSFNRIWGVRRARSLIRKVSDYLSLVLLCPILIAINGSMSAFAAAQIAGAQQVLPFLESGCSFLISKLIPFSATWILFVFIYVFIPNTRVKIIPAAFGGFIAALLYYIIQSLYIAAQFLVGKYNAIYGGFAAFPLFLLWLQVSWTVVLFGSQIVFSVQNVRIYEGIPLDTPTIGDRCRAIYALRIMRYCSIQFECGKPSPSEDEITEQLEIPLLGARQVLSDLVAARLLVRVDRDDRTTAYQVALPTGKITAVSVLERLQKRAEEHLSGDDFAAAEVVDKIWQDAAQAGNTPLSKAFF